MPNTLVGIALACFFSTASLVVVLFRVSPLTAPEWALPFLFVSVFIAVSSGVAFVLSVVKAFMARQFFLAGQFVGVSLRQGIFMGLCTCFIIFLHLLRILNWWIVILMYAIFVLLELALTRSE